MTHQALRPTAAIAVRNPLLRNLLREDLEQNGFDVRSVSSTECGDRAEIVVSDGIVRIGGTSATIRIADVLEVPLPDRTVVYPARCVDRIPEIFRAETERRMS